MKKNCKESVSPSKNPMQSTEKTKNPILFLLSDTSVLNATKNFQKDSEKIQSLEEKQKKLEAQLIKSKAIRRSLLLVEKWDKIVEENVKKHYDELEKFENSAIIIQKNVRGCLIRVKYASLNLFKKELHTAAFIHDLAKHSTKCKLTLGVNTIPVYFI